jgi:apolipoprotein N-acyltransferase
MTLIDFRRLFGILFTTFILILVFIFLIVVIAEKLSIITASILIIIPLIIRYVFYTITKI